MNANNPASRLYGLLEQLRRENQSHATKSVLARVFGVNESPMELMHAIVRFHNLANEVVAFAEENTKLPSAPLKRYIPQIKSAVEYTNLDAAWQSYVGRITDQCMLVLEMVAYTEGIPQDTDPSSEDFSELKAHLDDLFELVINSRDLDKEFRAYVLQQIEQIRRCLSEYRISGPQGFVKYMQLLIAQTQLNADAIKRQKSENPDVVARLKSVIVGVKKFVSFTETGLDLIKKVEHIHSEAGPLLHDLSSFAGADTPEVNTQHLA